MIIKTTRASNYIAVGLILLFWLSAFSNYFANLGHAPKIDLNPSLLLQLALSNTFVTIAFVIVFMLLGREQPRDIGFRSEQLVRQLVIGSGFGLALALVDHLAIGSILKAMRPDVFDEGIRLLKEFMGKINIVIWFLAAVFMGGFIEELQRLFIITRFERCFGTVGIVVALVMESLLQGAGHAYQGPERSFIYIFIGLAFGLVYLRKRSATEAMACHAVYDVFGLLWFTYHLR
jgi:membrane protease YdiL (CAAX protease family)